MIRSGAIRIGSKAMAISKAKKTEKVQVLAKELERLNDGDRGHIFQAHRGQGL
jgi:hypothetical protein